MTFIHPVLPNMNEISYTTINHAARVQLGLTMEEYCVCDLIHHLASNPNNRVVGWSYATKEFIAEALGLSRATAYRHIKRLKELSLVEFSPEEIHLVRATSKWFDTVFIKQSTKEKSQSETGKSQVETKKSQVETTLYVYDKDIDKDKDKSLTYVKEVEDHTVVEKKVFGKPEVNYLLTEFKRRWGYPPLDKDPRSRAWNLVQNIQKFIKDNKQDYSLEMFEHIAKYYLDWMWKQDYVEKIQKIETLKLKFQLFRANVERGSNAVREKLQATPL